MENSHCFASIEVFANEQLIFKGLSFHKKRHPSTGSKNIKGSIFLRKMPICVNRKVPTANKKQVLKRIISKANDLHHFRYIDILIVEIKLHLLKHL